MQVKPEQLQQHLARRGGQVFLAHGDETLLVQEAADLIRQYAREQGCTEREVVNIDQPADWQHLLQSAGALSLFAERKLVELRLPSGKPGTEGSKALLEYLTFDTEDILLIVAGKIEKNSQRGKWFTAIDKAGVVITAWPVGPRAMPRWLGDRLQQAGLSADRDALALLAERVEGNLLAASQEVEKLKLLTDGTRVTVETVMSTVLDNARYTSFGLADNALAGDAKAAIRTLRGLEAEATAAPVVLWALSRDVSLLAQLTAEQPHGGNIDLLLKQRGVWQSRQPLVKAALHRHNVSSVKSLQAATFNVDATIKGFRKGSPWDALDQLVLLMALGPSGASNTARRA